MSRAVFFDLDGTLVDTAPDLALALNMQREQHGMPSLPFETIRPFASHGSRGLLSIGFDVTPEDQVFVALRDEYLALYEAVFTRAPMLFPGMQEVLDALDNAQISWGVVTNKPRRFTQPMMASMQLAERTVAIVCGDDTPNPKPAPDSLLLACQQAGVAPEQCLYVGDAERDVQAAHAVQMPTVVANYGYIDAHETPEQWGAQACVATPFELLNLLKSTGFFAP